MNKHWKLISSINQWKNKYCSQNAYKTYKNQLKFYSIKFNSSIKSQTLKYKIPFFKLLFFLEIYIKKRVLKSSKMNQTNFNNYLIIKPICIFLILQKVKQ
jgi:hypothetical protein